MSDATLNKLFTGKQPRLYKVCAVCGAPRTVQVYVKLSELGANGTAIRGRTTSMAATLCTEHGLAAFNVSKEAIGR